MKPKLPELTGDLDTRMKIQRHGAYGTPIPTGECGHYYVNSGGEFMCRAAKSLAAKLQSVLSGAALSASVMGSLK